MGKLGEPVPGVQCDSLIDERDHVLRAGCAKFLFVVRTHVIYEPAGRYEDNAAASLLKAGRVMLPGEHGETLLSHDYWDVDEWSPTEREQFETTFRNRVQRTFGQGSFWLHHDFTGQRDFWCDIWLDFVEHRRHAHLVVRAVKNPRRRDTGETDFRAKCIPFVPFGGVDMVLTQKSVDDKERKSDTSDRGKDQSFFQCPLLHEFGHYMLLMHACVPWKKPWDANSNVSYCEGQTYAKQDDLMAIGNTLASRHGFLFRTRLMVAHGWAPWNPELYLATDREKAPWT